MHSTALLSTNHPNPLWNVAQLAQFFGCSERQIYLFRKTGLPTIQLGRSIRFDPDEVKNWLHQRQQNPDVERAQQLADIAAHGDEDNAECAAADLAREFPCDK